MVLVRWTSSRGGVKLVIGELSEEIVGVFKISVSRAIRGVKFGDLVRLWDV
jgi:hypothetical protein